MKTLLESAGLVLILNVCNLSNLKVNMSIGLMTNNHFQAYTWKQTLFSMSQEYTVTDRKKTKNKIKYNLFLYRGYTWVPIWDEYNVQSWAHSIWCTFQFTLNIDNSTRCLQKSFLIVQFHNFTVNCCIFRLRLVFKLFLKMFHRSIPLSLTSHHCVFFS